MTRSYPAHLRKNDRIVFLGDSITEQHLYTNYVETYLSLRYPDLNLTFFNAGWGGDTAPGGVARLDRDVLSLKPTVVTVCYGMNDGSYTKPTEEIRKRFVKGMNDLVARLEKARVRIILLTPGFGDVATGPHIKTADYNKRGLRVLANEVLKLARRKKLPVFDIHALMTQVDAAAKKANPLFTMAPDGVHPSPPGHLVMAHGLLCAMGVPPRQQHIHVDLAVGKIKADSELRAGLSLDMDAGLTGVNISLDTFPFYVEPAAREVLAFLPFQQTFNTLRLSVSGTEKDRYYIRATPQRSTSISRAELMAGINLFDLWLPQCMQDAAGVLTFTNQKDQIYFKFWRALSLNNAGGPYYDSTAHRMGITSGPQLDKSRGRLVRKGCRELEISLIPVTSPGEPLDNGDFVSTWSFHGPFALPFTKDHLSGEATFTAGVPKLGSGWRHIELPLEDLGNGLGKLFGALENCSVYALTVINSPVNQSCELLLGSDDGFALWLNGRRLGSQLNLTRGVVADQNRFPIRLKEGANTLLVKVSQVAGNWGFCVRFAGLSRLVFAVRAK